MLIDSQLVALSRYINLHEELNPLYKYTDI